MRALTLVALLTTSFRILTLGDIAKHTARARAHGLQVQTQQIGNLDKVRVDHIAVTQRVDERQRVLERFGATARRGNVARLLQRTVDKVHEGLGRVNARLKLLAAMRRDELHGVVAVGQHHAAQVHRILLDKLNRAAGSLLTGGVAIEHIYNALGKTGERLNVMFRQRCAQRGDDVFDPCLPASDAVGIALHHDGGILRDDKLLGPVKAIEVSFFMKHTRLGRVEVLWLTIAHDAPAKGDIVTLLIKDGKHHTVVKTVGKLSASTAHGHVGVDHLLRGKARLRQMRNQRVAARRKAQAVATTDISAHATAGKVLAWTAVLTAHKHGVVELGRLGAQVIDAGALGAAIALRTGIVQFNAGTVGQIADRLGKTQVLALHDIGKDVAALAAAKTVPHLRSRDNVKRWGLFAVKRAAAPKLMAAGLELNRFLHDGNQVRRRAYLIFFLIANHGCSPPAHPSYDGYRRYYPRRSRSTRPGNRTRETDAASA